jgi:hypothetical protein
VPFQHWYRVIDFNLAHCLLHAIKYSSSVATPHPIEQCSSFVVVVVAPVSPVLAFTSCFRFSRSTDVHRRRRYKVVVLKVIKFNDCVLDMKTTNAKLYRFPLRLCYVCIRPYMTVKKKLTHTYTDTIPKERIYHIIAEKR